VRLGVNRTTLAEPGAISRWSMWSIGIRAPVASSALHDFCHGLTARYPGLDRRDREPGQRLGQHTRLPATPRMEMDALAAPRDALPDRITQPVANQQ
jgi:hypothetical protein